MGRQNSKIMTEAIDFYAIRKKITGRSPFHILLGKRSPRFHALMPLSFTMKKLVPSFNVDSLIFLATSVVYFSLQQHLNSLKIAKCNNLPSGVVLYNHRAETNKDICYTNRPPLSRPWCTSSLAIRTLSRHINARLP